MKARTQGHYSAKLFWGFVVLVMVLIPAYLIYLPKEYFNTGKSICLYTLATGEKCSGCGLTRAVMHLIHLDYKTALEYNYLCIILFPMICIMYLLLFLNVISRFKTNE